MKMAAWRNGNEAAYLENKCRRPAANNGNINNINAIIGVWRELWLWQ